ncbi:MAG: DEAD/DEAH box helicase [Hyphomicrobiales bacterium]
MKTFSELGLAPALERAVAAEGYTEPTPIQQRAIPVVMEGRDVLGIAQTGTGKTAAFALPILHRLAETARRPEPKSCRVLVLSPTRELASQIAQSFDAYGRFLKIRIQTVFGGVGFGNQVKGLSQGVDVVVATPGRLADLMIQRAIRLDKVEILVLDEADRMLDMGFIHTIRQILGKLPKDRQTLFFSATMPKDVAELAEGMLRQPTRVAVTPVASTAERIDQRVVHVEQSHKADALRTLLDDASISRAIVFTRTKHGADRVAKSLARSDIDAGVIHGNKSQNQRERALAAFRNGESRLLIATDIAARGIDVDGISHVINFDLPNIPESYVHRIGRTARAGADGFAISFCSREERAYLRDIERLTKVALKVMPLEFQVAASSGSAKPHAGQRQQPKGEHRKEHRAEGHKDHRSERRSEPRQDGRQEHRGDHRADRQDNRSPQKAGQRAGQPARDHNGKKPSNGGGAHGISFLGKPAKAKQGHGQRQAHGQRREGGPIRFGEMSRS